MEIAVVTYRLLLQVYVSNSTNTNRVGEFHRHPQTEPTGAMTGISPNSRFFLTPILLIPGCRFAIAGPQLDHATAIRIDSEL